MKSFSRTEIMPDVDVRDRQITHALIRMRARDQDQHWVVDWSNTPEARSANLKRNPHTSWRHLYPCMG